MIDFVLLPTLILLGLGFLLVDAFDDGSDTESETLGDSDMGDGNMTPIGELPSEQPVTAIRLSDEDDVLDAGDGNQAVFAEDGDDMIVGGPGDDQIFLGDGDDVSFPITDAEGYGDDLIRGGDGEDIIGDGFGSNELFGDLQSDVLIGLDVGEQSGETPDSLFGGFGADRLFGDDGDTLEGGAGEDEFVVVYDSSSDDPVVITDYEAGERLFISLPLAVDDTEAEATVSDNGEDLDVKVGDATVLTLQGITDPDIIDLTVEILASPAPIGEIGENFYGSNENDKGDEKIIGTDGGDAIIAGFGDDGVESGDGNDVIDLSAGGNNFALAGQGDDVVFGGDGNDIINGNQGNDDVYGGGGVDTLRGGYGNDFLAGDDLLSNQSDVLDGGPGDDYLSGDDGDFMTGGAGADVFEAYRFQSGDAVVTVTDFDPSVDRLVIDPEAGNPPALSFVAANDGADTQVMIGDQVVFLLAGVTTAQVSPALVTIS